MIVTRSPNWTWSGRWRLMKYTYQPIKAPKAAAPTILMSIS